jgi:hypothetical protein
MPLHILHIQYWGFEPNVFGEGHHDADSTHLVRLLRSRRNWPSGCQTNCHFDEIASSHLPLPQGFGLRRLTMMRLQQGFTTSETGFNDQFALQKS